MPRQPLAAMFALAFMILAACGGGSESAGPGPITIVGYTVNVRTAPPTTAQVGASIPIAFTASENLSDGSTRPANGKSFTVAVTAGGGTINGSDRKSVV